MIVLAMLRRNAIHRNPSSQTRGVLRCERVPISIRVRSLDDIPETALAALGACGPHLFDELIGRAQRNHNLLDEPLHVGDADWPPTGQELFPKLLPGLDLLEKFVVVEPEAVIPLPGEEASFEEDVVSGAGSSGAGSGLRFLLWLRFAPVRLYIWLHFMVSLLHASPTTH
jgi:hypothetical protein